MRQVSPYPSQHEINKRKRETDKEEKEMKAKLFCGCNLPSLLSRKHRKPGRP